MPQSVHQVFVTGQLLINVATGLYKKLSVNLSWALLVFFYCQFENWRVYMAGHAVSCEITSFGQTSLQEISNHCWNQFVSKDPPGFATADDKGAHVCHQQVSGLGNQCVAEKCDEAGHYVWLPYHYILWGIGLFLPTMIFRYRHPYSNGTVDSQAEITEFSSRLRHLSKEELDPVKRRKILGHLAADFFYPVRQRAVIESEVIKHFIEFFGFWAIGWMIQGIVDLYMHLPHLWESLGLLFSGHIPWNQVNPFRKIFPRAAKCTVPGTGGKADELVHCDLILNGFNEAVLVCLYSWAFVRAAVLSGSLILYRWKHDSFYGSPESRQKALRSLPIWTHGDGIYQTSSEAIGNTCGADDFFVLIPVLQSVPLGVAREFVYVLGEEASIPARSPTTVDSAGNDDDSLSNKLFVDFAAWLLPPMVLLQLYSPPGGVWIVAFLLLIIFSTFLCLICIARRFLR